MPQYLTQHWLEEFHSLKQRIKSTEETLDPIKKGLTHELKQLDGMSFEVEGWKANVSERQKKTMNQDKLLAALKDLGLTQAIVTVEQVDEQVVEDLMYKGILDPTAIAHCLEVSSYDVLTVKQPKKKAVKKDAKDEATV